jgi:hypothetical protein
MRLSVIAGPPRSGETRQSIVFRKKMDAWVKPTRNMSLGFRKRGVRGAGNDPRSNHRAAGWPEDIRRLRGFIPA